MIDRFRRAWAEFLTPTSTSGIDMPQGRKLTARKTLAAGNMARDIGDWASAAQHYAAYVELWPDAAPVYVQLGNMLSQMGDAAGAERAYRQALAAAPSVDGWVQLGRTLAVGGRRTEAIEALIEAGRLDPRREDVRIMMCEVDAPELTVGGDHSRSSHARDLALVGGRLEYTLDAVRNWLEVSTYPADAYDAFRRNFPLRPPPQRAPLAVTVVVDAIDGSPSRVRASLLALQDQTQSDWSALVLASPALLDHPVASLALVDGRIRFSTLDAAEIPSGALLSVSAGTVLHAEALAWFAFTQKRTAAAAIYCDNDRVIEHWRHGSRYYAPVLHPMPDPEDLRSGAEPPEAVLLATADAADALKKTLMRHRDLPAVGAAARRDLLLDLMERRPIAHLPRILASVSELPDRADRDEGPKGDAASGRGLPSHSMPDAQIAEPVASLAIIIPTRDQPAMLRACVESLFAKAARPGRLEVIIADNRSREAETAKLLSDLAARFNVTRASVDEPFNWSRINNLVAAERREEILVFANNDMVMMTDGWDDVVRRRLAAEGTGVVGARLLYPDGTVQHGGMAMGVGDGPPRHEAVGALATEPGPSGRWIRSRSAAAVTGAFLAVRREAFERVEGFDAANLAVGYNDVDFCLRIRRLGLRVVFAGDLELIHLESRTRGRNMTRPQIIWDKGELRSLYKTWGEGMFFDPARNPQWASTGRHLFDGYQEPTHGQLLRHIDLSARLHPWTPPEKDVEPWRAD